MGRKSSCEFTYRHITEYAGQLHNDSQFYKLSDKQDQEKQFRLVRFNVSRASDLVTLSSRLLTQAAALALTDWSQRSSHTEQKNGASILPSAKGKLKLTVIQPVMGQLSRARYCSKKKM